jgi:hypothetical protein
MKVKHIVLEEVEKLHIEGVADKYAEKRFNIPDPNTEMEKRAMSGMKDDSDSMGEYVGDVDSAYNNDNEPESKVYLNPKNLQNFGADVRALSDLEGNLFVAQVDRGFYHNAVGNAVNNGNSGYEIPDAYDANRIIQWHRIGKTNNFGFSISYMDFFRANPEKGIEAVRAVQKKNPQFIFHPAYWYHIKDGEYDMSTTNLDTMLQTSIKDKKIRDEIKNNPRYKETFERFSIYDLNSLKKKIPQIELAIHDMQRASNTDSYAPNINRFLGFLALAKEFLKKYDT